MKNEKEANVLASVIKKLYKNVRLDNINYNDEEFSYDFKSDDIVSENDFLKIEEEMNLVDDSLLVKLLRISGVYKDGDSNNEMIVRIVGKSFNNLDEYNDYLNFLEEAKLRDHRRIGADLDLFCFSDLVGPGLPLFSPKGAIIRDELQREIEKVCRKYGFMKVSCPSLADIKLFEISGHASKFNDELFRVSSPKGHEFVLKPVQCPHHAQIYASKIRSYKDLPIRYMESDKQYRAELQGAVGNSLSRVYAISVEDGHSFCRIDQVRDEIVNMCNLIKDFYSRMNLWNDVFVSLSVRDYQHPEKYIGDSDDWDYCEEMLQSVSDELNLNAVKCEGEAALYGPKLDFMFKDALGRLIQIPTVQVDFASPKRFNLYYIGEDGKKEALVMVHRAVLGSYERFMVLLLEQFKGVLPVWLSPVQVNIIPVNMKYHDEYAKYLFDILNEEDIRVSYDDSKEQLGKKIRNSNLQKIPFMLVIGDYERDNKMVSLRRYNSEEIEHFSIDEFILFMHQEIKKR